jgi:predicted lipid-binding transport protein (Tim44 family)
VVILTAPAKRYIAKLANADAEEQVSNAAFYYKRWEDKNDHEFAEACVAHYLQVQRAWIGGLDEQADENEYQMQVEA